MLKTFQHDKKELVAPSSQQDRSSTMSPVVFNHVASVPAFQERQRRVFEAARAPTSTTQDSYDLCRRHLRSAQIPLLPEFGFPAPPAGLDAADRSIARYIASDSRVRENAHNVALLWEKPDIVDTVFRDHV